MVFRGRASRNCANCRAVKRRCDKQLPHCGQCIRMREKCPGYRDEWDLVFRDQTGHTIKRYKEKMERSADSDEDLRPPSRPISPSVDEIGVNYFVRNFVIGGQSASRGYLNYVPTVYLADGKQPTLNSSIAAVGLVALANSTRQPQLASHARAKYAEAIHNVNIALASPVESLKDSTLMSVISLGVFEQVSGFDMWVRHVRGAASLVAARGKNQFSSPVAVLMFNQVRADLAVACLHYSHPIPDEILELQEEASKHTESSSPFWRVGILSTRCTNFLYRVRKTDIQKEGLLPDFLKEATVLERDFQDASRILAKHEPYKIIRNSGGDPNIIYNGRYDLYRDTWAIRVWNNARNLHMITCHILVFMLGRVLATDLTPAVREHLNIQLQETLQTLTDLGDDMLATVPQVLEFVSSGSSPRPSHDFSFNGSVSGGYMITWCLYMVGKSPVTTRHARKWIIPRMEDIGRNMGISIALELLEDVITIDQMAG